MNWDYNWCPAVLAFAPCRSPGVAASGGGGPEERAIRRAETAAGARPGGEEHINNPSVKPSSALLIVWMWFQWRSAARRKEQEDDFSYTRELRDREQRLQALEEQLERRARWAAYSNIKNKIKNDWSWGCIAALTAHKKFIFHSYSPQAFEQWRVLSFKLKQRALRWILTWQYWIQIKQVFKKKDKGARLCTFFPIKHCKSYNRLRNNDIL